MAMPKKDPLVLPNPDRVFFPPSSAPNTRSTTDLVAARGTVAEPPAAALNGLGLGNGDDVDGDGVELL